jgi:HemY protein
MRRIITIIIAVAAVVAIAWWIVGLPGHIEVAVGPYSVAAAAPVAVLLVIALIVVAHLVIRLLTAIVMTPNRIGRWNARRRRGSGDAAITATLVAIAAGDKGDAGRAAGRARRHLGDTPQTLLLAAEASRLEGDEEKAAEIYRALAARDDAAFLGLRGLFRQALGREDWTEASAIAQRAEQVHPGAAWLREERAQLAMRTGDWARALTLAGPETPMLALTAAAAEQASGPAEGLRLARQAFRQDPGFVPGAIAYARRLRAEGREGRAQDAIRAAWKENPHPELAELALAVATDKTERMRVATKLVAANPTHPESYFLLAKLHLAAGQLADARRAAESARSAGMNTSRLWLLIADIEGEDRGTTEAGRLAQRDALRHAATAEPDSVWRCEACGTVHKTWQPACPVCHVAGKISWGPPKAALIAPPIEAPRAIAGTVVP